MFDTLKDKEIIEPFIKTILDVHTEGQNITPDQFIQAVVIDFAARQTVLQEIYGNMPDAFLPFRVDKNRKLVLGKELFAAIVDRYAKLYKSGTLDKTKVEE